MFGEIIIVGALISFVFFSQHHGEQPAPVEHQAVPQEKVGFNVPDYRYVMSYQGLKPTPKTIKENPPVRVNPCLANSMEINFSLRDYKLSEEQKSSINAFVGKATYCGAKKITISGSASPVGMMRYNKWLSKQRAMAVKKYLDRRGVSIAYQVQIDPQTMISERKASLSFN
ncbi:OmpA family protein [Hydrogenovibrio marinus]|uniref:OmpA-like domain-containing protein n=1 Tax=Hydrogenovibrio marinus TaxID=28885 RepID=A0A066ZLR0_HYDMR|nr:OmpA family protein [Hydrogenovibrio marinus]KDN94738.1 hypothetical protein EI16_12655 [Hydrogenovibrio marinus]